MGELSWSAGRYMRAVITDASGMFRTVAAGRTDRSGRFEGSSWA
jgi:hypothetical protein